VSTTPAIVTAERIADKIHVIRGQRVMLDFDLATLYGVLTHRLNEQVKRNLHRFPQDFMFRLSLEEFAALTSQIAISKRGRGGRRSAPYAFTEHGAVMLASVLNSPIAVEASIQVVRAFIQLRALANSHADLASKLNQMERKYDSRFKEVFDAIRQLTNPPDSDQPKQIGFRPSAKA
jgi:hypothetical protein